MYESLVYGTGIGLALAWTGGGGVLAVPALMLGMGMSLTEAVPVSLTSVGIAAALGTFDGLMRGLVRYRAAMLMALSGAVMAPAGIALAQRLPQVLLTTLFIVLLCFVGVRVLRQTLNRTSVSPKFNAQKLNCVEKKNCLLAADTGRFKWNQTCFLTLSSIGGVSGLCSGMLGVGGGFVIVPGLSRHSNLALQAIVATSLMVVALIACSTVIHSFTSGQGISTDGWWFVFASCLGMLVGRLSAPFLPGATLQISFACLTFFAASILFYKMLLAAQVW